MPVVLFPINTVKKDDWELLKTMVNLWGLTNTVRPQVGLSTHPQQARYICPAELAVQALME